jgi:hypothetical protein
MLEADQKITPITEINHYPDGGIGVIPGLDNPIQPIRGFEFFRLNPDIDPNQGDYATALDKQGRRYRLTNVPIGPDTTILILEEIRFDKYGQPYFVIIKSYSYTEADLIPEE